MSDYFKTDINFEANAKGDIDRISGLANLKKRLNRRLITTKGSLIGRPNYGVGIKKYQNKINDLATKRKIFSDIVEQFEQDDGVNKVLSVSVENDPINSSMVVISVSVEAVGIGVEKLQFNISRF